MHSGWQWAFKWSPWWISSRGFEILLTSIKFRKTNWTWRTFAGHTNKYLKDVTLKGRKIHCICASLIHITRPYFSNVAVPTYCPLNWIITFNGIQDLYVFLETTGTSNIYDLWHMAFVLTVEIKVSKIKAAMSRILKTLWILILALSFRSLPSLQICVSTSFNENPHNFTIWICRR